MIVELLFDIGSIISLAWSYVSSSFYAMSYALQAVFASTQFAAEVVGFVHPIIGGSVTCTVLFFCLKFLIGR